MVILLLMIFNLDYLMIIIIIYIMTYRTLIYVLWYIDDIINYFIIFFLELLKMENLNINDMISSEGYTYSVSNIED